MEKYIVSARKYRPVTFDTVVGQPSITRTLKNAILHNHLAQAFLFTGPRGVGKTTTARILAKTINCINMGPNAEACNVCDTCRAFNEGHSLNIYELDAASNNSVDDMRALVDQVRYAPQMGKYKVYIIDEVHMLSTSAFNAFLKTLEEPPSYAIFILATTEKHKIIPTILSRCQIFDFNRITVDDTVKHLQEIAEKENVQAEEDALHIVAQKADGSLRDALSLFDQLVSFSGNTLRYQDVIANLNILDYEYYFRLTDELLSGNISNALLLFNEILANGFDAHNFISGLASHARDLLVCKDEVTLPLLETSPNVREKYKVQSRLASSSWLLETLDVVNKTDMQFKAAKNQRLHVELALIKLCMLQGMNSTQDIAAAAKKKTEQLKKVAEETIKPSAPVIPAPPVANVPAPQASPVVANPVASPAIERAPVSEPAAAPKADKQISSGPGMKKSISISSKLNATSPAEIKKEAAAPVLPSLAEEFTLQQLEVAWAAYADRLEKEGRYALRAAMVKRKPTLSSPVQIHFLVDNASVEKDLNEIKMELLGMIREKLSNYQVTLITEIQRMDDKTDVPYTPSEKFKKLAEKNPLLLDLKKDWDLEIEY